MESHREFLGSSESDGYPLQMLGSVRKEMSKTPHGTSQCDHGGVAFRELVEARYDPAVLFLPAKHPFDDLALSALARSNSLGKPGLGLRFIERSGITGCIRY